MEIVEGKDLVTALRSAVDLARDRLWMASPYIGGWPGNVRRIIGTHWQQSVKDVRLLTDVDERGFRLNTLKQFFRRGSVRTLAGLHAKLYIADDFVLLTSANLTGTAFSKRYEAGIVLTGRHADHTASLFQQWWKLAHPVLEEQLSEPRVRPIEPGESNRPPLPMLVPLPPDVEDEPLPSDSFGDYDAFLTYYEDLATTYKSVQRLWSKTPLYFEIDGFLNFLYHDAPGRPSNGYEKKAPRNLTTEQRRQQIRTFAARFAGAYAKDNIGKDSPTRRSHHAKVVRQLLQRNLRRGLTRSEIKELLGQLNSMRSYPVNIAKVVNPHNNTLGELRAMLREIVDESVPLQRRMANCSRRVFGISKASIQELVGFYYAGKYPLRNLNTNCGLRFFGYHVRIH